MKKQDAHSVRSKQQQLAKSSFICHCHTLEMDWLFFLFLSHSIQNELELNRALKLKSLKIRQNSKFIEILKILSRKDCFAKEERMYLHVCHRAEDLAGGLSVEEELEKTS